MNKVTFVTQGCRLNQSETAALEQLFIQSGYTLVNHATESSDIAVVNTCTVTENGDADYQTHHKTTQKQNNNIKVASHWLPTKYIRMNFCH